MKLETLKYEDVLILKFTGEFDAFNLPRFSAKLDEMVDRGARRLVLDLHALKFINSAALGYLIKTSKRLKELGGAMVIARPSKFIQKTLATLGLDGVFTAFETVEIAVQSFKTGTPVGQIQIDSQDKDEAIKGVVPVLFAKIAGPNDEATPRQIGKMVTLYEDGLLFEYQPKAKGAADPVEGDLVSGSTLRLKFRQPLAMKEHYFEMTGSVVQAMRKFDLAEKEDDEGVIRVRVKYERIGDDDRKQLQQFVRDLESFKGELKT